MSAPIRVAIVDDQAMVRAGFTSLLAAEPDIEVVGDAADGEAAVDLVCRLKPDVTLMDIRMPLLDGISATRRLVEAQVETKVLVLTTFDLDQYCLRRTAGRRFGLAAQGRNRRGAGRRGPGGRRWGVAARTRCHPSGN